MSCVIAPVTGVVFFSLHETVPAALLRCRSDLPC
jgi:hypothetical protein